MSSGTKKSDPRPTLQSIAEYVKKNAPRVKTKSQMSMGMGHEEMESVREVDYKGHHIEVRTSYKIAVDGSPIMGHLNVTNAGQVQYHAVPNMGFDSVIDLVKHLIDMFPDEFGKAGPEAKKAHAASGHAGMDMSGMKMSKSAPRKSKGK